MTTKLHDVLVLNRSWLPIHIVDYKKAMSLIYQEHAHSLDAEFLAYSYPDWVAYSISNAGNFKKIRTVSYEIAVPEIVVLTRYNSLPDRDVKFSRENVFTRDKYICQYCGGKFTRQELTVDHVIPKKHGGTTKWVNIVACCISCNRKKADRSPEQAGMRLLKIPVQPRWVSPLYTMKTKVHVCKGWVHFMDRIHYD